MRIEVKQSLLAKNDVAATENRELLKKNGVAMLNLMAAPGAGKTSAIMKAIEVLRDHVSIAVIEGDLASEVDSLAIEAMGITAIQINTDRSCHLNASMVRTALDHLDLEALDLIIIENVGNLVCPAEFDLGENRRILLTSVTEGHDKPYKYPFIFKEVDAIVINKIDLLPYCDFDMDLFRRLVTELNPDAGIFELSCMDGSGIEFLTGWLETSIRRVK